MRNIALYAPTWVASAASSPEDSASFILSNNVVPLGVAHLSDSAGSVIFREEVTSQPVLPGIATRTFVSEGTRRSYFPGAGKPRVRNAKIAKSVCNPVRSIAQPR